MDDGTFKSNVSGYYDDLSCSVSAATTKSMFTIKKIEEYVTSELNNMKQRSKGGLLGMKSHDERSAMSVSTIATKNSRYALEGINGKDVKLSIQSTPTADSDDASVEISLGSTQRSQGSNDSYLENYLKMNEGMRDSKSSAATAPPKLGSGRKNKVPPSYVQSENDAPNGQNLSDQSKGGFKSSLKKLSGREKKSTIRSNLKKISETEAGKSPTSKGTKSKKGTISSSDTSTRSHHNQETNPSDGHSLRSVKLSSTSSSHSLKNESSSLEDAIVKLQIDTMNESEIKLENDMVSWEAKVNKLAELIEEEKEKNSRLGDLEKLLGEKKMKIQEDATKAKMRIKVGELERLLEIKMNEKNRKLEKLAGLLEELKNEKKEKNKIYAVLDKRSKKAISKSNPTDVEESHKCEDSQTSGKGLRILSSARKKKSSKTSLSCSSQASEVSSASRRSRQSKRGH